MFNMRHRYQRCTAILLSVLLPCLCSCAPTPQAQESRIQPVSTAVSAPDRILLEAALPSGMQVVIDAPVHLTAKTFSAINCTERDFTLAEIRRVYSALCGNAQPYQWAETQENLITYIGYCQSLLALAEGAIDDELLAYERAYLNDARKKIPSAPIEKQPADWNKLFTYPDGSLQADLGKEWDAYFQVLTEPYSLIYFKNYGYPPSRATSLIRSPPSRRMKHWHVHRLYWTPSALPRTLSRSVFAANESTTVSTKGICRRK